MDLDLEDLWLQGKASSTDIGISGTSDFNTNSETFSPFEIDTASQSLLNGVSGRPIMSYSGADLVDSSFDDGISFQKRATSPLASVGKFAPSQLSSLNTNFGVDSMLTNDGFDDDVGLYLNEPRRQTSAQTPLNSSSLSSSSSSTLASVSMSTSSSSFVMPGVTNVAPSQSINSTTISTRPHIALDDNDFDFDEEEEEEEEEEEIEKPIKGAGTRASTRDRRGSKASSTGGGTYLKSEEKERKERTSFVGMTDEERKATRLLRNRESARQSRQRKKQYIDLLESRVSTLQVQVQEKRILHASSAPQILDEQRQMLVLALEPLATRSVNGIPLSIEEEATLVDAASQLIDRFGPDCAERRASRDFFFDQLQRILLPPHTKFLLWLMNQPESFFGESVHSVADSVARLLPNGGEYNSDDAATLPPTTTASQTALWGLFCSQIGLTLEQADKFKQQLRSIFHLSETPVEIWRLGIAMTYLQRLRSAISGMAASTHNQYVKAREILSPAQLILFVAWTERNKDRLSHNVEQILTVSVPKS